MARPGKQGLDYFSFDTDFFDSETVRLIDKEFQYKGTIFIIRLMCTIYKKGYFMHWTKDKEEAYAVFLEADPEFINKVINRLLKWKFFDAKLFNTYGILTSDNFQCRYFEAVQRRANVKVIKEYLLIDLTRYKNHHSMECLSAETPLNNHSDTKTTTENPEQLPQPNKNEPPEDNCREQSTRNELMSYFGFNKQHNYDKYCECNVFINFLSETNKLEYFKKMLIAYQQFKKLSGQQKHSFKGFLGTMKHEFINGGWNAENWEEKPTEEKKYGKTKSNNSKRKNPVHASTGGHEEESL